MTEHLETAAMTAGARRVRGSRLVLPVAVAASLLGLAGCNASALTKVELVVYFQQNAPVSDRAAALNACAHAAPDVTAEPIVKSKLVSDQVGDVRFRIDHASDKDIALLTECLNKQPGVKGFATPDLTD